MICLRLGSEADPGIADNGCFWVDTMQEKPNRHRRAKMKKNGNWSIFRTVAWLVVCLFCVSSAAFANTWYVDGSVGSSGVGDTWSTAFKTIQEGINAAINGDEVWVAEWTYLENINFLGKAVTLTSTNPDDPDVVDSTIIDGHQAGSVVTFNTGEVDSSILTGFTIQNGTGTDLWGNYRGGGIYCRGASPRIMKCKVINNHVHRNGGSTGGGIYCEIGSPSIEDCIIDGNSVIAYGDATSYGGGIAYNGSGSIINCTITGNSASGPANKAVGGGIYVAGPASIAHCIISENSSVIGGGCYFLNVEYATLTNCIISNNSASNVGGGIYDNFKSKLTNCTITGNTASHFGGGGMYCAVNCSALITNCIFWGDYPDEIFKAATHTTLPVITYSDIQGGHAGVGNIKANPLFVSPGTGDYSLQCESPCIDAGSGGGAPSHDIDGTSRPQDGGYDIGAYESIAASCVGGDPNACEGDLNIDGLVDLADFVIFKSDFGRNDCPVEP